MKTKLTTHALDTFHGRPAGGMAVTLRRLDAPEVIASTTLNEDGRCGTPLLEGDDLIAGPYEIHFGVGPYFLSHGVESPFLNEVPIRFNVLSGQSYHVPLVFSPWAYQTYRGS